MSDFKRGDFVLVDVGNGTHLPASVTAASGKAHPGKVRISYIVPSDSPLAASSFWVDPEKLWKEPK